MTGIAMLIAWLCGLIQGLVIHVFYTLDGGNEDDKLEEADDGEKD